MSAIARIAVIGDLHGHWDDWDARYFSQAAYDLVLVTGDLGSGAADNGVRIARSLGRLSRRALVMPGNNDVQRAAQIGAELGHQRGLLALLRRGIGGAPEGAGQVHLCGYSLHPFELAGRMITVLAARPYTRGGPQLAYGEELRGRFGIGDMEQSTRKLCELVAGAPSEELIVLAHNGPAGLGELPTDIWGRDFSLPAPPEGPHDPRTLGDWGDPDLARAIAYARSIGKRVLAVVGGHMHTRTRSGEQRVWRHQEAGTLYVNASKVPRIWEESSGVLRYHVVIEIEGSQVSARELAVREAD
jgi:uncharacterized protein (TIGR04168 family)